MGHAHVAKLAEQCDGRWRRLRAVEPAIGVEAARQRGNPVGGNGMRKGRAGVCRRRPKSCGTEEDRDDEGLQLAPRDILPALQHRYVSPFDDWAMRFNLPWRALRAAAPETPARRMRD